MLGAGDINITVATLVEPTALKSNEYIVAPAKPLHSMFSADAEGEVTDVILHPEKKREEDFYLWDITVIFEIKRVK